jgi:hypothetical protein
VQNTFLKKLIPIFVLSLFVSASELLSQPVDYPSVFGRDWEKASAYLSENRHWIDSMFIRYRIDPCTGIAIIFPELVRYSALRDKMEITLLKALYVSNGTDYANFSIGRFQVKPSFAEDVSDAVSGPGYMRLRRYIPQATSFSAPHQYRSEIVKSLEDPKRELAYIIAFIKICTQKYSIIEKDNILRVLILSASYNCGLKASTEEVLECASKKFYSTRLLKGAGETYSYSDISVWWYRNNCSSDYFEN